MTKKCLLIDSYGFIFRAFHVQPPLTSPIGEPVGAIYGFTSMLIKLIQDHNPTHIAAIFDYGGKNFRHEIFPEYKAHRPEVSLDLIKQFPIARIVASSFNLKSLELQGFEADDIIATLAKQIANQGEEVIIVSGDKDLAQLMSDKIKIFDPGKGKFITEADILEKFGVEPVKIRDVLAIIGDKSDNIPGVPGFGPKTAADLIAQFGSFNSLLTNYNEIESERKRNLFVEHIEKAKLSYELVGLKSDIKLEVNSDDLLWKRPEPEQVLEFLNNYGFKSLINRASKIAAHSNAQFTFDSILTPQEKEGETIPTSDNIELLKRCTAACGYVSIHTSDEKIYLESNEQVFKFATVEHLKEILADESILKILYNIKYYDHKNWHIVSYADLAIMSYVISAGLEQKDLSSLVAKYNQQTTSSPSLLCKNIRELYKTLYKNLIDDNSLSLYLDIDYPISKILHKIEQTGVKFDIQALNKLSQEFELTLQALQTKVFAQAGQEFNIGSPKQLGEILFDHLKLPGAVKSSKTGAYSTNVDILEELRAQGFEIADNLLKWRQISKLKNTYTDSLPKLENAQTKRIHTTLLQTSTATSRLSSIEPNLQNIPIRTKEGERIRSTLIAEEGCKLISADYSQIELRILAELADIKDLQDAFINNIDVHSKTASQVFHIPHQEVSSEQRRKAKAINFGIIYGISSFGLAAQLNISRSDAKDYIERYFAAYPGIREYMDKTKKYAAEHGYVVNYLGRKCFVPTINDKSAALRSFAERAAINAPIQGSASDIVKVAMINIDKMILKNNFKTKVILQVHDELLFETPENEVEIISPFIKKIMESATNFKTKLKVELEISNHWG